MMSEYITFKDWCMGSWETFHGEPPNWARKDFIALTKIWKELKDEKARKVWTTYLRNEEPFHRAHPPSLLLSCLSTISLDAERVEGLVGNERVPYHDPGVEEAERAKRDKFNRERYEILKEQLAAKLKIRGVE